MINRELAMVLTQKYPITHIGKKGNSIFITMQLLLALDVGRYNYIDLEFDSLEEAGDYLQENYHKIQMDSLKNENKDLYDHCMNQKRELRKLNDKIKGVKNG